MSRRMRAAQSLLHPQAQRSYRSEVIRRATVNDFDSEHVLHYGLALEVKSMKFTPS
jgi:hypothetical protein